MTFLSSFLGLTDFRNPFLRNVGPPIALAFGLQSAVSVPMIIAKSEKCYDISGSLTYIACAVFSLYTRAIRARSAAALAGVPKPAWPSLLSAFNGTGGPLGFNWRQVALSAAVGIWAARLGTFLFGRILYLREESRFDNIRNNPLLFLGTFGIQAVWVSTCLLPVIAINSLPPSVFESLGAGVTITDIAGILMYVGGMYYEVVSDEQKNQWHREKKQKKHNEDFITRELWSKSRHPNYFGESLLWTGIATTAAGVLVSNAAVNAIGLAKGLLGKAVSLVTAGISPAFITYLLVYLTGVPLSEDKYDKLYGHREDYQKYKRETPVYIPKF